MAKDANLANVSLLLRCEGPDGSAVFTDSSLSPKSISSAGGGRISTAHFKYGGASARFNNGDYLTIADHVDFGFGTSDLTIEFWVRPSLTGDTDNVILDFRPIDAAAPLAIGLTSAGAVRYYDGVTLRTGGALVANVWSHVVWCRIANVNTIYVNGVAVSTYTAFQDFGSSRPLCIGVNVIKSAQRFIGNVDEIRITKGLGRYTGAFTPPAFPFPRFGDFMGVVTDASKNPVSRLVRAMREDTGAFVEQAMSDSMTGTYFLQAAADTAHTLTVYPGIGENLPALSLRGVMPV